MRDINAMLWMALLLSAPIQAQDLRLNAQDYFEARGAEVLVFANTPGGLFNDAKTGGIELVHHGERTATNGDVRLNRTPEQWDAIAELVERKVDAAHQRIETRMRYPQFDFDYRIEVQGGGDGVTVRVLLDKPLPKALEGRAGFNLEFVPVAYFGKSYLADGKTGLFPRHPSALMDADADGATEPRAIASGKRIVLAPEDPLRRVTVQARGETTLQLYDGRNKAQNGWYVLRSPLPAGRTGKVIEWQVNANTVPDWLRAPVIAHSQVGYHPAQDKLAVIELDRHDTPQRSARLVKIQADGGEKTVFEGPATAWGRWLRYNYLRFDFSQVREPGLYRVDYGAQRGDPFRIDADVYADVWHSTLDVYLPVQMDHVRVREGYRTWHGASHLDDALQAPPNYEHFDLYAMGAQTDTKFASFEHIPGLNVGGWLDAGDFDIRTQTQYHLVGTLVQTWERFRPQRDTTTVSQQARYVELHRPDGKPDLLQQIEHGTRYLLAQYRAVGHAIHGIVEAHLYQYPHLGDALSKTDGLVYDKSLDPHAAQRHPGRMFVPITQSPSPEQLVTRREGERSGEFDDRWAFTTRASALDYGSAAALAAASRALRGYDDALADEALRTAQKVWDEEQSRPPYTFKFGNTTGGPLADEEFKAAVELLQATKQDKYARRVAALLPEVSTRFFGDNVAIAVRALPMMDAGYKAKLRELAQAYVVGLRKSQQENPFGVIVTRAGWAGNAAVVTQAIANDYLRRAFPDLLDRADVYRGLDYLFGTHPGGDHSFVSAVGAKSQLVAYGMNRADFSYIAGGVVPGVLVLPPDLPENRTNWPFFWGQNEYVVDLGGSYLYLANAVQELLAKE